MWAFLFGLIDPITKLAGLIAQAQLERDKALTDQERIASAERVAALQAQMAVLVADSGRSHLDIWIRAGFALPFIVYNIKLILWDKVLALGSTDRLSAELANVEMVVIGFYFVHSMFTRGK